MILPATLALATAFSFSFAGILIKGVSARFGGTIASLAVAIGNIAAIGAAVFIVGLSSIGPYSLLRSVLSGIALAAGYMLFYRVLERQQVSNTFATLEVQVLILATYGIFFLGEKASIISSIGILSIIIGVLLVSVEKGMKMSSKLAPAVAANVFWAISWILLVYPINHTHNYLLPVWISFITFLALVSAVMLRSAASRKRAKAIRKRGFAVGILAGVSSGTGNSLYSVLILMKQLVLGAVISNISPAIIAVVAHFVYHDKLTKVQILGIAAVVAGGMVLGMY